ncbi:MAG: restriction endonuclease [Ignavibacteria bacterium]|jgi:restriction system protein|nr:restriction endonuclease [Ignavibacteria bacterium]
MARPKKYQNVPQVDELYVPLIKSLKILGGSGNIEEINEKIYELEQYPDAALNIPHGDGRTEIEYRLAWARTKLKQLGILENSARSVWALTNKEINEEEFDKKKISKENSKLRKDVINELGIESEEIIVDWKDNLLQKIFSISPDAFERLTQRILRESGFIQVEVTGKVGDGGIDGKGIVRVSGFLSFHVIFQCKRYKSSVTASQIRDFRGAMQGRADKGLFVTTGTFTRDAIKEATRDGAPPIDLIDGELLCDKLKELKLGINVEYVEDVKINYGWFDKL